MSFRVSNVSRYASALDTLQQRQAELSKAQMQMTAGKRVNVPSDDPTAAARAERAFISQQRITAEQRAVSVSRNAMTLVESSLGQATDLLQSSRETLISAGNASYSPAERKALAVQLQQLRGQLLAVANQTDGAGGYIFGGQGTTSQPFLDSPSGVTFAGTGGQGQLSVNEQMPTSVDGQQVWLSVRSGNGVYETDAAPTNTGSAYIAPGGIADPSLLTGGNYDITFSVAAGVTSYTVNPTGQTGTYQDGGTITVDGMSLKLAGKPADGDQFTIKPSTVGLDPFEALDRAIAVLNNPNANAGAVAQAVSNGVRDVDQVMSQFSAARSVAGATLSRLDSIDTRNQDRDLWAKSVQSDAEDLDMVQAVSDFQNKQTSYQAALQSYSMVQKLSLFDYIK
ncbi:flagellar hook-associated protein FlgL [Aquabacterium sp.]|uniref:flagellar hook-associated protein FlgL n=1 Tax=Aquabacterium sp. TaxID=1872578 RepID=UPI0037835A1C